MMDLLIWLGWFCFGMILGAALVIPILNWALERWGL
jgi:hypothetical protein